MSRFRILACLPLALGIAGCAATPPLPPPPPFVAFHPDEKLPAPQEDAGAIAHRAARANYALDEGTLYQNLIQLFAFRAHQVDPTGFNMIYGYGDADPRRVTVLARAPIDRAAYLALAAPELRPHIGFRESVFDRAAREAAQERLSQALPGSIGMCLLVYSHERDRFDLQIREGIEIETVRDRLPPDLAPLVDIGIGGCPVLL